jgi:hypothetical protein
MSTGFRSAARSVNRGAPRIIVAGLCKRRTHDAAGDQPVRPTDFVRVACRFAGHGVICERQPTLSLQATLADTPPSVSLRRPGCAVTDTA